MSNNQNPSLRKKHTPGIQSVVSKGNAQKPAEKERKRGSATAGKRTTDQVSQKTTRANIAVEDLIDAMRSDENIYEEFKQILRDFEIKSMKELRKRLESEGESDRNKPKPPKESKSTVTTPDSQGKKEKELHRVNERKSKKIEEPKKGSNSDAPKGLVSSSKQKETHDKKGDSQNGSNSLVSKTPISSEKDKKTESQGKPDDVIVEPTENKRVMELERTLQEKEKELEELNRNLKTAQKEKEEAKAESDRNQAEIEELKRNLTIAQKEKEEAKTESNKIQADSKNDKASDPQLKENRHMKESEEEPSENTHILEKEKEIEKLKAELEKTKKEAEKNLNPDTKKLKDEIDQLKNRLSQLAGSKLTEGNPAIADLSDMNRPINLGEKFSELYDNQWTDAFEELVEEGISEDKAISELVKTVTEANNYCITQSEDFHRKLKDLMKQFGMNPEKLPTEVSKQIKDHRKGLSISMVQDIQERFCKEQNRIKDGRVKTYAKQCIAVCWFMSVQDPPVFMDSNLPKHNAFDTEKFKAYTKTGKKIHFLVWPALYLHEGGPLLSKGVAQGR